MSKVTVICSVYNVDHYIGRFIQSMKSQTLNDFLVFFINDGSTDKSTEIIKQYTNHDYRFHYIHVNDNHEVFRAPFPDKTNEAVNYGIYATRNTALDLIDTEYFTFVDPDDWIENDYLEKLVKKADSTHADITKATLWKDFPDHTEKNFFRNIAIQHDVMRGIPAYRFCGSQAITCLFRRGFIHKNNFRYLDRNHGFEFDSDDIFLLECLLANPKISFCNDTVYHYEQRPSSAVHEINEKRYISTTKARQMEIAILNKALEKGTLSLPHYQIIALRIMWELSAHYRIYLKHKNFNKNKYLETCKQISSLIRPSDHHLDQIGFIAALTQGKLKEAHSMMTTPLLVTLDQLRKQISVIRITHP